MGYKKITKLYYKKKNNNSLIYGVTIVILWFNTNYKIYTIFYTTVYHTVL